jgi:hypothetical protein
MENEQHQNQPNQGQDPEETRKVSNEQETQEQREKYIESVMEYIQRESHGYSVFDGNLERVGLLAGLEERGVLPVVVRPSPYEPDDERYVQEFERRDELLKYMQIGATLQHFFPNVAPRLIQEEQTQAEVTQQAEQEQRKAALFCRYSDSKAMFAGVVLFEEALERRGLLRRLDERGVWPGVPINPNPYEQGKRLSMDELEEIERRTHWWAEHPEESKKFNRDVDKMVEAPRYMYIGALIARNFPNLFQHETEGTS